MNVLKRVLKIIGFLLIPAIIFVTWYAWNAFPAISGFGAKNMCSAVFLQHRSPESVSKEELADFPMSMGSFEVNYTDSSVTGKVWGFAERKAIFRKGIGATLVNQYSENQIRSQTIQHPLPPEKDLDTTLWPRGDSCGIISWKGIDKRKMDDAVDYCFNEKIDGKPCLTRAVIVVKDGNIIAEKYARGYDMHSLQQGWSMTKSVTSALIGLLVDRGTLSERSSALLPQWKNDSRSAIQLKHLLQQRSGLDFKENYKMPGTVTRMLFSEGDMAAYTASQALAEPPGTRFYYSSGNSNILSLLIRKSLGDKSYYVLPYDSLFYRISAFSPVIEPDASGTFVGSSYIWATARDYARFGLLYLNEGNWFGDQILSTSWINKTRTPATGDPQKKYGYQFWLNGFSSDLKTRIYPGVPEDMYMAEGFGGQIIVIIPSKKMVVVRLGVRKFDDKRFLRKLVESVSD